MKFHNYYFYTTNMLPHNLILFPQEEFDYWKTREECRTEFVGDVSEKTLTFRIFYVMKRHTNNS